MPKREIISEQDRLFVEEYLANGLSRAKAVLATNPNIAKASAKQIAYKTMKRPAVRKYIDERLQDTILSTNQTLAGISDLAENAENDRDRIKAYELIGKYHKLFTERSEISIDLSELTDDQLAAIAQGKG